MNNQILITAVGEDRPGIVAQLTAMVAEHGGNLEVSRMAVLGGDFAIICLVTAAEQKLAELEASLKGLTKEGMHVFCKRTKGVAAERFTNHNFYNIVLSGADHEGIVHSVAAQLRDLQINFQSVETDITHAPVTGSPLFTLHAKIAVPQTISFEALSAKLAKIADDEAVDIELESSATITGEFAVVV